MSFPLSYFLFFFSLVLGPIISISSTSWFGAWIGLELNALSFIPLIAMKMNPYYSESALKYFLIQALGSALLIMSSFILISTFEMASIFLFLALLLKLGAAPFHFWFPQVMEGLAWPQAFLLMTLQKLAPMILLSYLITSNLVTKMTIMAAMLTAVIGALGGLNNMHLRKIIAFSSINHMSWMLMALSVGDSFWLFYFLVYTIIVLSATTTFSSLQTFTLSDLVQSERSSVFNSTLISMNFLSLGGLPPLTGFIPKWLTIQIMADLNLFIPLFFLLVSALITLYFYLRIIISFLIVLNPSMSFNIKSKTMSHTSPALLLSLSFNLIGLLTPFYFFIT
uniref:NADH-ubiquinone oxidoreductase chain 2 n=1 Tax=Grapsus albolineatus TaxID=156079 RepID=A0A890JHH5_9EUCA|nr:NADH dehydrogenase subunit 2 [Grapsus albolineatus]QRH17766.1 NADH dehydrogenase subunit 2 [Grapsus albolineatus]UBD09502.1 NADH dehydrogenase subunit 2 [Grapsus albolineatus]